MSKPTPGPLFVTKGETYLGTVGIYGHRDGGKNGPVILMGECHGIEGRANAILWSAAPDMLEFLKNFCSPGLGRTFTMDFDEARKLIDRAEGRGEHINEALYAKPEERF